MYCNLYYNSSYIVYTSIIVGSIIRACFWKSFPPHMITTVAAWCSVQGWGFIGFVNWGLGFVVWG